MISGCVQVTPPSGTQCASAYGPSGSPGGTLTQLPTATHTGAVSDQKPSAAVTASAGGTGAPNVSLPGVLSEPIVEVTRIGTPIPDESSKLYSKMNEQAAISPEKQLVPIYELKNQSYPENTTAYAFTLQNPPLYIELGFYPLNVTVRQTISKRTGDKVGDINMTLVRPSSESQFKMMVYNRDTGKEVLEEGYGKEYSMINKTVTLMSPGNYQFEFSGKDIRTDITFKAPVDLDTLSQYKNLSGMIDTQKKDAALLGEVYLKLSDLPPGWIQTGDVTHEVTKYSSIFVKPDAGQKFTQTITRCSSADEAKKLLENAKVSLQAENPAAVLVGDEGFSYENVRKSSVQFRKGVYYVDLTSNSVPPVTKEDLLKFAAIIAGKL